MRHTACLSVNPITSNNFVTLLIAKWQIGPQTSMKLVWARSFVFGRAYRGSTVGFLLLQWFSKGLEYSSCFILVLDLDLHVYVCCFDAVLRVDQITHVYEPQLNLGREFCEHEAGFRAETHKYYEECNWSKKWAEGLQKILT